MSYTDFIEQNIAPYSAKKIGVYNSSGNKVGIVPLGSFKPSYGERLYRFGLLSDVHNQSDQSAESTEDLQRALAYFNEKESVWATCICGDISQNGTASEFQIYKNNVDAKSPSTPVYTTVGNHDATTSGLNTANWNTYTGHDRCFEITKNNDHFLFFGMNKWSLGSSGTPYLDSDIDWLEEKLEEYRNQRVFVFTHLFFPTRAGNLNDIYPNGNWLGGSQLTRIQALNDRYKNSIWFSGHSHWKWYLQKYQDRANIYKNDCGWCVHVPSCASPIDSNGTSRDNKPLESEGAIVDVYENYIDIRGMNLKNQKYLPIAQYRLNTTLVNIDAKPATTYAITNNLTNCTNSNTVTTVTEGSSYNANISANEGYELSSVIITMGGTDVTSSVYSNGVITIASVTGDIVITATTAELPLATNSYVLDDLTNCIPVYQGAVIDSNTAKLQRNGSGICVASVDISSNTNLSILDEHRLQVYNGQKVYAKVTGMDLGGYDITTNKIGICLKIYDESHNILYEIDYLDCVNDTPKLLFTASKDSNMYVWFRLKTSSSSTGITYPITVTLDKFELYTEN